MTDNSNKQNPAQHRHPRGEFGYTEQQGKPRVYRTIFIGLFILAVMVFGFGGWAVLSPLESAAIAEGKLTVKNQVKTIQHLEGGIIKNINIKEGEWVKAGDPLIILDDIQPNARYNLLHVQANERIAEHARLIAERDKIDTIQFPNYLFQRTQYEDIKHIIQGQVSIFQSNKLNLSTTVDILNKRINQLNEEITSLHAQIISANKQLSFVGEELEAMLYLDKKGLIEKPRILSLQREEARLQGERGERQALISRSKQQIGETRIQIINTLARARSDTLTQLRETQRELADLLEQERAAEDVLKRTVIRSPIHGRIVGLKVHTNSGVIAPREDLMTIVPDQEELLIEARINPLDIDVVYEGLPAKVTLSAYKQRHFTSLEGMVTHVSADSFSDERTGETYYTAYVKIEEAELAKVKDLKLYQGMPAQVMIITNKHTPWEYFIIPIRDSLNRAFRED